MYSSSQVHFEAFERCNCEMLNVLKSLILALVYISTVSCTALAYTSTIPSTALMGLYYFK